MLKRELYLCQSVVLKSVTVYISYLRWALLCVQMVGVAWMVSLLPPEPQAGSLLL